MMRTNIVYFDEIDFSVMLILFWHIVIARNEAIQKSLTSIDCFVLPPTNDKPGICHSERSEESHRNKR